MKIVIVVEKDVRYIEELAVLLDAAKVLLQTIDESCDGYSVDVNDYLIEEKQKKEKIAK